MILKKYLISATTMALLTSSIVNEGFAQNSEEDIVLEKMSRQSSVSITASNKTIKKGTSFNPKTGVTAKDYNGSDITQHILVTKNEVNVNQAGAYKVAYVVLGSNGQRVTREITVTVIGDSNEKVQTTIVANDITVNIGSSFNPMSGVKATDVTGKDITNYVVVASNNVNTKKAGSYVVKYVVLDTEGKRVYKTRAVTVKSSTTTTKETVINAEDKTIKKGSKFDPMEGVKAIDLTGKDITQHMLVVQNTVNTNVIGVGTVKYLVLDTAGNRVYKTIEVTVSNGANESSTEIVASDLTLNTGDVFDERKGVTAIDVTGKDITPYIVVTKNNVNTNKAGTYNVTYLVLDTVGERVYKTVTITVKGENILTAEEKKVQEIISEINSLGSNITCSDLQKIKNIRLKYNTLSSDMKKMVSNIDKLEDAEVKIDAIMLRITNVIDLIDALPTKIQLSDEKQVQEARNAFNALSDEEKNTVPFTQIGALESAEATISLLKKGDVDKQTVASLISRIEALIGQTINIEDHEAEIKDIRAIYDSLEYIRQDEVTNYQDFLNVELELTHIYEAIIYLEGLIEELPQVIETSDGAKVEEAKKRFDELTTKNQVKVKQELVEKLNSAIAQTEILKKEILESNAEVQTVVSEIEQLPNVEDISIDDKDQVFGVIARYRMLSDDVKFAVDTTTLEESFDKIETIMAQEVIELINSLPSINDLDLSHATLLEEVRAKYDEISSRNNNKVANINKLTELETKILELKNVNLVVVEIVNKIKDLDHTITFDNYEDTLTKVLEIEALLETIEFDEFDLITNLTKYEEVLLQLDILGRVNNVTTGAEVVELINKLPEAIDITWGHGNDLVDARNAFDKISDNEKLLVSNIAKLEQAEVEYNRINNGINEVISAIHRIPDLNEITLDHEQIIIEARNLYNSYDEKVTYYVNQMNVSRLLNAESRIEELKNIN